MHFFEGTSRTSHNLAAGRVSFPRFRFGFPCFLTDRAARPPTQAQRARADRRGSKHTASTQRHGGRSSKHDNRARCRRSAHKGANNSVHVAEPGPLVHRRRHHARVQHLLCRPSQGQVPQRCVEAMKRGNQRAANKRKICKQTNRLGNGRRDRGDADKMQHPGDCGRRRAAKVPKEQAHHMG